MTPITAAIIAGLATCLTLGPAETNKASPTGSKGFKVKPATLLSSATVITPSLIRSSKIPSMAVPPAKYLVAIGRTAAPGIPILVRAGAIIVSRTAIAPTSLKTFTRKIAKINGGIDFLTISKPSAPPLIKGE